MYFAVPKSLLPTVSTVPDGLLLAQFIIWLAPLISLGKGIFHAKLAIGSIEQARTIQKINILHIFFIISC
jgi:hypothetical protein